MQSPPILWFTFVACTVQVNYSVILWSQHFNLFSKETLSIGSGEPGESKASTSKEGQEARKKNNWQSHGGGGKVPHNVHRLTKFEGNLLTSKAISMTAQPQNKQISSTRQWRRSWNMLGARTHMVAVENLGIIEPPEPDDPPHIWEKHVNEYVKCTMNMTENIKSIFSLVWGQFTDIMC